jgi:hypothetical protein
LPLALELVPDVAVELGVVMAVAPAAVGAAVIEKVLPP